MNIQTAKRQIMDTVEAYLERNDAGMHVIAPAHQRPIFLLGAPGIGKTAIMEQVAEELGIGIVSYSMTHHTRQSVLGLPRIEHRTFDGFEFEASEYTMSEIVAAIYDYMERTDLRAGILFLDEINCVSETLYPSMLQFLQFKTFGKHKVPDGWVVVCAGNPPEYNRSVHEFDIVTLDRLRQIDVEPDYAAWKRYASEVGLHPAVTTFLEAKKDCFYKVEAKPGGGKAFVTARGWEDLARIIALYEDLDKPVDRELFAQFIRDEEIADQFGVYYALFQKYRSDYQVDSILAGCATDAIRQRAQEAAFDERVALIGLMLDVLSRECQNVLDLETLLMEVRDVLRQVKPELLAGASVDAVLLPRISTREAQLARRMDSGAVSSAWIRREKLVIELLRSLVAQCGLQKTKEGPEAFHTIERTYKEEVAKVQPAVDEASAHMDAAFEFLEENFGSREMLVFMAELATRHATTQFIAHHGNDQYYAHNQELQVDSARTGLAERVRQLEDLDREDGEEAEHSGAVRESVGAPTYSGVPTEGDAAVSTPPAKESVAYDAASLKAFYDTKQFEYGFASVCKMLLPASDLRGKRVLDIGCRRGRGVYKISSMVGADGRAIGIDWSPAYIEEARDGMTRAWHDSGLPGNNMEFFVAYPENLMTAGLGNETLDAVYVNNVVTLFKDQAQVFRECARVLKPGGLFILETVFADRARDEAVVDAARELGNSIQAARTETENLAWLEAAGFETPTVQDSYEVAANRGYKADETVETVLGDDNVRYCAVCLHIRKPEK